MDATPHIHAIVVKPWLTDPRSLDIAYGDQSADYVHMIAPRWWARWRARAIIRKLIRRHDRQSWLAGQGRSDTDPVTQGFALKDGQWGSDQLGHHG